MSCPHSLRTCPSCEVAEKIVAERESRLLVCGCDPEGDLCHEHKVFDYDRKPSYPAGVCLEDILRWQRLR